MNRDGLLGRARCAECTAWYARYLGEVRAPSPVCRGPTSDMQARPDRSTFHFHMRQYKLITAETIDSLDVFRIKFLELKILMF